jgi:hypothetical protein
MQSFVTEMKIDCKAVEQPQSECVGVSFSNRSVE